MCMQVKYYVKRVIGFERKEKSEAEFKNWVWIEYKQAKKEEHHTEARHAQSLSHVCLFATLWIIAPLALLSMGFSRQEYWSGLQFLLQRIFLTQESNLHLLHCKQILYLLSHLGNPKEWYRGRELYVVNTRIDEILSPLLGLKARVQEKVQWRANREGRLRHKCAEDRVGLLNTIPICFSIISHDFGRML